MVDLFSHRPAISRDLDDDLETAAKAKQGTRIKKGKETFLFLRLWRIELKSVIHYIQDRPPHARNVGGDSFPISCNVDDSIEWLEGQIGQRLLRDYRLLFRDQKFTDHVSIRRRQLPVSFPRRHSGVKSFNNGIDFGALLCIQELRQGTHRGINICPGDPVGFKHPLVIPRCEVVLEGIMIRIANSLSEPVGEEEDLLAEVLEAVPVFCLPHLGEPFPYLLGVGPVREDHLIFVIRRWLALESFDDARFTSKPSKTKGLMCALSGSKSGAWCSKTREQAAATKPICIDDSHLLGVSEVCESRHSRRLQKLFNDASTFRVE